MEIREVLCKSAASRSGLPGLDWALNPYRGCSHACRYCYAQDVTRFEMGKDWGEVVEAKVNFVPMLKKLLAKNNKGTFGLGTVTDPYQPVERRFELTRGAMEQLKKAGSSISILTKSDLVLRDIDFLRDWSGAEVGLSIGSIDEDVARMLEPGAPSPRRRVEVVRRLTSEGVDTYVMAAPIVPGLSDSEDSVRSLIDEVHKSGARRVMWDKFNPKPMASSRLRRALSDKGFDLRHAGPPWVDNVRRVLRDQCSRLGIELLEAF